MRTCLAAGAVLLLALEPSGVAQQQPATPAQQPPPAAQPAAQPPVFRAGINYVRVDVIVSDKAGNPIAEYPPWRLC